MAKSAFGGPPCSNPVRRDCLEREFTAVPTTGSRTVRHNGYVDHLVNAALIGEFLDYVAHDRFRIAENHQGVVRV